MLVNTYKGIPVSFPAIFIENENDEFKVKAHPFQSLCIDINKLTIIQSSEMDTPLMAFAASVDPADSIVTLTNIRFASHSAGNRKHDRVVPMEHVDVSMTPMDGSLNMAQGIMNDVSLHGVGFHTYEPVNVSEGDQAVFSFSLVYEDTQLDFIGINGIIRNIFSGPEMNFSRIGVELQPDEKQQSELEKYLDHRIKMINEELQLLMPIAA